MLVGKIIDDVLNDTLIGTYRAHFNALDGAINASQTELVFKYPVSGLGPNAYVEIDQELMYVVPEGVNETAKTFSVIRGVRRTTAATHADAAGCMINPRFPRATILSAMQEEARSWPISLFRVDAFVGSLGASATNIDLATDSGFDDIIRVVGVYRKSGASSDRWINMGGWRFENGLFGPGTSDLYISDTVSTTVRIMVARPFSAIGTWTEASDITTVSGMLDSHADILKYGAAWRVVTGRETRRLFTEVEAEGRVAGDVPASSILTLGRQLKMLRDARVGEEIHRLRSLYPLRST